MPEWPIGTALKAVVGGNVNRGFESRPLCAMTSVYRLDRRLALQLFGWRMIMAGACAMITFIGFGVGGFGRRFGWVFLVLTLLFIALAAWTMARPPLVASLNAQGFRLGRVAEGDVRKGHWTTVSNVNADQGRLVFSLESGQTGSVALMLLPRRAAELQRDVHERLNTAHGYRRIN